MRLQLPALPIISGCTNVISEHYNLRDKWLVKKQMLTANVKRILFLHRSQFLHL